jgi:hypothetical protein
MSDLPTQEAALKAIDDAFCDGLKRMFEVLVQSLEATPHGAAAQRFAKGFSDHLAAYQVATEAIRLRYQDAANG